MKNDPILSSVICGLNFINPVGLAAGYDKDGEVPLALLRLGFGFVEVGTLTPLPQSGNVKPRLFRLVEDEAVINRLGFNNQGQDKALIRLNKIKPKITARGGILGVNLGANKDSPNRMQDYAQGVATMAEVADYLTINISSPNTHGLRQLQDKAMLQELLQTVLEVKNNLLPQQKKTPIFLKIAPDLTISEIEDITNTAIENQISALIVANTTVSRPDLISSKHRFESGGLSGKPIAELSLNCLKSVRIVTNGQLPLISVGGIDSADEAYRRIKAGASLVQLYTALVYHGPFLARKINRDLLSLLQRDGFTHISQAIGAEK
jgi:dihydroorotate dehydrogenase